MPRLATLLACAAATLTAAATAASAAAPVQIQLPVVGLGLPGQPPLVSRSSGAQGFYLGRPMTATALAGWLRELGPRFVPT